MSLISRGSRPASPRSTPWLALVLLVGPTPAWAMGTGNAPPIVDSVQVSPDPAVANGAATVRCAAHDTDGNVTQMRVAVTGGALEGGGTSAPIAITPAPSATGSIAWTAPGAGTYSVTCTVWDSGGIFGGSASAAMTISVSVVEAVGQPPVIDSLVAPSAVQVGSTVQLAASAHDPEGGALDYSWNASGGTIAASGETAVLTAPATPGTCVVELIVKDATGLTASAQLSLAVVWAPSKGALGPPLPGPRRIAAAPEGFLYMVDGRGGFHVLTARGEEMAELELPDRALAVAAAAGRAYVSTLHGKILQVSVAEGRVVEEWDVGYAQGPMGLAYDAANGLLWMAEREAGQLRALGANGATARVIRQAGAQALMGPSDVALDAAAGLAWVVLDYNPRGALAHAFNLATGAYVGSAQPGGTAAGQVTRAGGIAVDAAGRVLVSDAYAGAVQVTSGSGQYVGALGRFGTGVGELRQPSGLVVLPNGDILVASSDNGRVERFGINPPATCPDDSDCDGLPDAWELAFGLNAHDARDALADADGDGLRNLAEYSMGTNPRNADSDGDGYSDGDEVFAGFNPLDPMDHSPTLMASSKTSGPGLVQWTSELRGRGACSVAWTQTDGPKVALRDAATAAPSFVARAAARYTFRGVPRCGGVSGEAAEATITVRDVAPRADAGRVTAVRPGQRFLLDGSFSSDANGGALAFSWDQTLGSPLLSSSSAASQSLRARRPGLYSFQLTASDGSGLAGAAEVPVLVVESGRQAPTAMASTPVLARANEPVVLDASESVGPEGDALAFTWRQLAGPPVALSAADVAAPSFTPEAAGRYAFELIVSAGELRSPAQEVEVYVAPAGGELPVAIAAKPPEAIVGEPLSLEGSATAAMGGALSYAWRQASGPAAGLTRADEPVATVVPFEPGTYVFELRAKEGDAESLPARVQFDVGEERPVASASASGLKYAGDVVQLDGVDSTSPGSTLRYRWTQVAGPWVALDDATSPQPSFVPRVPGLYAFELEVDDGQVRSAPVTVSVLVFPRQAGGGQP